VVHTTQVNVKQDGPCSSALVERPMLSTPITSEQRPEEAMKAAPQVESDHARATPTCETSVDDDVRFKEVGKPIMLPEVNMEEIVVQAPPADASDQSSAVGSIQAPQRSEEEEQSSVSQEPVVSVAQAVARSNSLLSAVSIQAPQRSEEDRQQQSSVSQEPVVSVAQAVARSNSLLSEGEHILPMPLSYDRERACSMTGRSGRQPASPSRAGSTVLASVDGPASPPLLATGATSAPPSPTVHASSGYGSEEEPAAKVQSGGPGDCTDALASGPATEASGKSAAEEAAKKVARFAFGKELSAVAVLGGQPTVSMLAHFVPKEQVADAAPATAPVTPMRGRERHRPEQRTGEPVPSLTSDAPIDEDGNEWLSAHRSIANSASSGKQVRSGKGKKKGNRGTSKTRGSSAKGGGNKSNDHKRGDNLGAALKAAA